MLLHFVSGEVDATMGTLFRLVHAEVYMRSEVFTLTGVATAVGAVNAYQLTGADVGLCM